MHRIHIDDLKHMITPAYWGYIRKWLEQHDALIVMPDYVQISQPTHVRTMIDNRAAMAAAILTAILETNQDAGDDIYVDPEHAREALLMALAAIMEADPSLRTPQDVLLAGEAVSRDLRIKLKSMRDSFERTGERLWNAEIVRPN